MKKTPIRKYGFVIVFLSIFVFVDCSKNKHDYCSRVEDACHIAGGKFWNTPGPEACKNYKTAIINYMNSGCITEEEKQVLSRELEITNNPALCP